MKDFEFEVLGGGNNTTYTIRNVPKEAHAVLRKLFKLPVPSADWMPQIWPFEPDEFGSDCHIEIDWKELTD